MSLAWMLSATLFAALLLFAAHAAESIAGAFGRPRRWLWTFALLAGATWPLLLPLLQVASPGASGAIVMLPGVSIVANAGSAAAAGVGRWLPALERGVAIAWALVTMLLATRLVLGMLQLRRLRSRAEVRRIDGVEVLVDEAIGPAAVGVRRPAVIVPRSVLELEEPLRRLVLRHEREHCAARDPWQLLASAIVLVLVPWNLPLWLVARRLHLALEVDCDARVLASGVDATRYGQLLLWTAHRGTASRLAPMLAGSPSHLERRIIAMRERTRHRKPLHLALAAAVVTASIAAACSSRFADGPLGPSSANTSLSGPSVVAGEALLEFQVEELASQIPGEGRLRYPTAMRTSNTEGEVLAQFVVDAQGVPEPGTFKVLKSSHEAFATAVAEAVPTMRFRPARVGGRAVRQLVQTPFTFGLSRN